MTEWKFYVLSLLLGSSMPGSSQIRTLVGGNREGVVPCVGQNVTYVCSIPAPSHAWNVPKYDISTTISVQTSVFTNKAPAITMHLVTHQGGTITSSLSVIAFAGLNGTRISCMDSTSLNGESQEIVVDILGEPSPPSLDIVASGDLSSLSFTIFPPTYAVSCVLHYAVTTIRYRNSQTNMMDFTIPANTTNPVTLERDGFDMCRERYNFTVRSLTRGGEGMRSDIIRLGIVDFIDPVLTVATNRLTVSLLWMVPTIPRAFNVTISYSTPSEDQCVEYVDGEIGRERTQVKVGLNCSYASHTVTFCVQFSSATCQSNVARIVTSKLSALAVSEQITYPQMLSSNSIALLLNVDEDVICTIMEDFQLKITIKRDSEVITSKTLPFADNIALFHGISPGEYNCTTNVVNGAMQLESTTFNCTSFVLGKSELRVTALAVSLSLLYILSIAICFGSGVVVRSYLASRQANKTQGASKPSGKYLSDLDY